MNKLLITAFVCVIIAIALSKTVRRKRSRSVTEKKKDVS